MKKLIILLFVPFIVLAQSENQSQSIELPDFVITGRQTVTLPAMQKAKPELVPILSREFFFPAFSPEEFNLAEVSLPERVAADLFTEQQHYKGQVIIGAGRYTLPAGEFHFGESFGSGQFYAKLWGANTTDFVDNSDYNVSGIQLNTDFFVDRNTKTLPGLRVGIGGGYIRDEYKFYGSTNPSMERERQRGSVKVYLENQYDEKFKYGLNLNGSYFDIQDNPVSELDYSADAFVKFTLEGYDFGVSGKINQQKIEQEAGIENTYEFYNAAAFIKLRPGNSLYLTLGGAYYKSGDSDLITPGAELGLELNKNFTFYAKYNPFADFVTLSDFHLTNRYLFNSFDNLFVEYKTNIETAFKYQYGKYYEITFGGKYSKIENYFYFSDFGFTNPLIPVPEQKGLFGLRTLEDVTSFSVFVNALYHLGPFGWFYGDAAYNNVKGDDNFVPYEPQIELTGGYGYKFPFGLTSELRVHYINGMYVDIQNNNQLDDYINLSAEFKYSILSNLDLTLNLQNLLNRDNFLWNSYIEKPFDIIAGIDYRF